jgi:V8-like Glu-specific endopeptidase
VAISRLKNEPGLTRAVMEAILQTGDDREPITDTLDFPWRCVCHLVITAQDDSHWVGTGWLASPRTLLTAGHCVYLHGNGGWAKQIEVYPARNGDDLPYSYVSTDLRSVSRWTEDKNAKFDYGAILLPEDTPVGYFGYESRSDGELLHSLVNVYGYPADKQEGTLWGHYRQLGQVLPRTLVYNISTFGGQSGCPVFLKNGDDRVVVGIHNYGDVSGNSATRITDDVFDDIEAWKAEAP